MTTPSVQALHYFFAEPDSSKWPVSVQREFSTIVAEAYQDAFHSVPYRVCVGKGDKWYSGQSACPCQGCTAARAANAKSQELIGRYHHA